MFVPNLLMQSKHHSEILGAYLPFRLSLQGLCVLLARCNKSEMTWFDVCPKYTYKIIYRESCPNLFGIQWYSFLTHCFLYAAGIVNIADRMDSIRFQASVCVISANLYV